GTVPHTFYTLLIAEDEALARIAAESIVKTLPQLPNPTEDEKDAMGALAAGVEMAGALAPAGAAAVDATAPGASPPRRARRVGGHAVGVDEGVQRTADGAPRQRHVRPGEVLGRTLPPHRREEPPRPRPHVGEARQRGTDRRPRRTAARPRDELNFSRRSAE